MGFGSLFATHIGQVHTLAREKGRLHEIFATAVITIGIGEDRLDIIGGIKAQLGAIGGQLACIIIIHAEGRVLDRAIALQCFRAETKRQLVLDDRGVDHECPAKCRAAAQFSAQFRLALIGGIFGPDHNRPGQSIPALLGGLRAAQNFDLLDIPCGERRKEGRLIVRHRNAIHLRGDHKTDPSTRGATLINASDLKTFLAQRSRDIGCAFNEIQQVFIAAPLQLLARGHGYRGGAVLNFTPLQLAADDDRGQLKNLVRANFDILCQGGSGNKAAQAQYQSGGQTIFHGTHTPLSRAAVLWGVRAATDRHRSGA